MKPYKADKAFENNLFLNSREARTLRILSEYLEPEKRFNELDINHTVVFFGSARVKRDEDGSETSRYYRAAEEFAGRLAKLNRDVKEETGNTFYVCTGGGPGIMEAANRGASEAGEPTIGLNIELPFEQYSNPYITNVLNFEFHYFFMRKLWFLFHAKAVIIFPGGFGTMDELFETLTLVQTKKMEKLDIPIMLYDREFWDDLINFNKFVDMGLISPEDLDLMHFFTDIDEGIEYLKPRLISNMMNLDNILTRRKINFQS
jgi:uncharacterized protein (TIGR00730 family)